jgi:hypothetical protein
METENRIKKIEEYLLDPQKATFKTLEEHTKAIETLLEFVNNVDFNNLEMIQGEDGVTPVRGVDYFTDEDIAAFETFILDRMPIEGVDYPTVAEVENFIAQQVAKIPRIKGDKGDKGAKGDEGKQGSPDTAKQIIAKVKTIKKPWKISDVDGLEPKIKLINDVSDDVDDLKERFDGFSVTIQNNNGGGGTGGGIESVVGEESISVDASDPLNPVVTLLNDEETPGISQYYGTDGTGVKGFHSIPTGGVVAFEDLTGQPTDNTALNAALNGKADALTADQNYVTDSQLVVISNTSGTNTGDQDLTPYFNKSVDDTDDISVGATNKFTTASEKTKLGFISVTQNVDLDTIESDTATNNAKVSNATHTGDVTGATTLTLATVNSNVGSFTNANITVNAKGLVTAASNGSSGVGVMAIFKDEKTAGTAGGTPVAATWTKRTLNTTNYNAIPSCTLSSDVISLPAGTYSVTGRTKFYDCFTAFARLRNTTDGTTLVIGTASVNDGGNTEQWCTLDGVFTLATTKNIELQYYTGSAVTNGLGINISDIGQVSDVFSSLTITKIA